MANPTHVYVDPSIAADSGTGTVGDPYGDLQYALDTVTRDATNGNQFNVKSGTAELITTSLDFSTYGAPTDAAPAVIRGYTTAANDDGMGEIDMQGNNASISATARVYYIDMDLHSTGTAAIIDGSARLNGALRCILHDSTGLVCSIGSPVIGCHIYDMGSMIVVQSSAVLYNYIDNTQTTVSTGRLIDTYTIAGYVGHNILVMGANAAIGIAVGDDVSVIDGNSILSSAGTGTGIRWDIDRYGLTVINNLVEGFSGTGGAGFDGVNRTEGSLMFATNAAYNNTTDYANTDDQMLTFDNESLGATPFAKSGANTFANRLVYFKAVNTGNVQDGAFPDGSSKGSVNTYNAGGGGGGMIVHPGMGGGFRG